MICVYVCACALSHGSETILCSAEYASASEGDDEGDDDDCCAHQLCSSYGFSISSVCRRRRRSLRHRRFHEHKTQTYHTQKPTHPYPPERNSNIRMLTRPPDLQPNLTSRPDLCCLTVEIQVVTPAVAEWPTPTTTTTICRSVALLGRNRHTKKSAAQKRLTNGFS